MASTDVLETVARINGKLVAGEEEDVLESLRQLQAVPMSFAALEATKIGRAVNALRKSASSEQARELAAALYRGWKALAFEHLRNSRRSQAPKPAPASALKKPATLSPKTTPPKVAAAALKSVRFSLPVKAQPTAGSSACRSTEKVPRSSIDTTTKTMKKQRSKTLEKTEQRPVAVRQRVVQHTVALPKPAPASKPKSSFKEAAPPAKESPETVKARRVSISPLSVASASSKAQEAPKPSSSSAGNKRKQAPTSIDEASLERTKRRLHERYQEATAVKEKRRIQVINAPGTAAQHHPMVVRRRQVRCTAATPAP